jgi:hypothetical protein
LVVVYKLGNKTYREQLKKKIDNQYDVKISKIYTSTPLSELNITYMTIVYGVNRKSYRTYDPSLPFDSQISKGDFSGYRFGFELNHFHSSKTFDQYRFFNLGLLRRKDNNLADLTASKISDETEIINGTTTRKAGKEYSVYSSPIDIYEFWNLYIHYYYFFGKAFSSGIHISSDNQFRDNGKGILTGSLGYVFGFNNKKDNRTLNTELFLRFNDLTNELNMEHTSIWKRSQIGITFGLPIYIP